MSLHYHKLGRGPNILLAFHGVGQNGESCFLPFAETLGEHYTIYAFDLFFHGKDKNADLDLITKSFWKEIIQNFIDQNSISRFDIAGFSMGGRFALATLEAFAEKIENLFLIAPDGISEHPVYSIACRFHPGRQLFKWSMERPEIFFKAADAFNSIGLLNTSLVRFTKHVLNTPEKRQTVYKSWLAFRQLRFDMKSIHSQVKSHNVRIYLITGKFDKLLTSKSVKPLADLLPENQNIILKSGHTQLVAQAGAWISSLFE
ncbi:alpha/beta hydrolase [Dyadobacter sp. CY323]|uniref:alpha/beta hydrolase n=1 Tax=Dyadobacter sp. CY323 TaxID=2907302 RepID=UPI001F27A3FD|nr:alpha/beta hydrolase [Dyadobacter sp. CY323]MCE6989051.1 alpha/beta hydrolase [Dyadobacter sp. CY323]